MALSVLMYHFVRGNSPSSFDGFKGLSLEEFENQIEWLCNNRTPLTHDDFCDAAINGKKIANDGFYLTFDDGTLDHVENVLPVLHKKGLTATFFPVTQPLVEGKVSIVEKQRYLQYIAFQKYSEFLDVFCSHISEKIPEIQLQIIPSPKNIINAKNYLPEHDYYSLEERFYRKIRNEYISEEIFKEVINAIFSCFYENESIYADEFYLNSKDLLKLKEAGMTIGGHSHTHPLLTKLYHKDANYEITKCLSVLGELLSEKVNSFAYPFGIFNQQIIDLLVKNDITYAFCTTNTAIKEIKHFYTLPRIDAASFSKVISF